MNSETQTIETKIPSADWVKTVTAVDARAKSGYDWQGEFLKGTLIDLEIGSLIIDCSSAGSSKHPSKDVDVRVLMPNAKWIIVAGVVSNDWASELRGEARKYLAMDVTQRVKTAAKIAVENWTDNLAKRREKLARVEAMIADLSALVNSGQNGALLPVFGGSDTFVYREKISGHLTEQLAKGAESIAEAEQKIAEYDKLAKTKRGEAIAPAILDKIEDGLMRAIAELVAVAGSQEKAAQLLGSDKMRRAIKAALKPAPVPVESHAEGMPCPTPETAAQ